MRYRRSLYVHDFSLRCGILALYHAVTTKVAYLSHHGRAQWEMLGRTPEANIEEFSPNSVPTRLVEEGFLVAATADERRELAEHYAQTVAPEPEITVLKLFITTCCNLDCTYCLIGKNIAAFGGQRHHASPTVITKALEVFARHASRSCKPEKNIFLYGGEPLTNWSVVRKAVESARALEKEGRFGGSLELVLETNGTLLSEEVCNFLAQHNVYIIVSLDGLPRIHDHLRVKSDGSGSFGDALAGYHTAVKSGCTAVVSTVATPLMLRNIEAAIEYLVSEVKTPSIGLDLPHLLYKSETDELSMVPDHLVAAYIRAFEVARRHGLYVEHIMRRIRPFVNETVRTKDCPACGNRMVVAPDGAIGICEGFIGSRHTFETNVFDDPDLRSQPHFREWDRCSPLLDMGCHSCLSLAVCGGGCPYNSYVASGKLLGHDEQTCLTSKGIIEWLISDLARQIGEGSLLTQELHVATQQEKVQILGKIPSRLSLPLIKNISQFAEGPQSATPGAAAGIHRL